MRAVVLLILLLWSAPADAATVEVREYQECDKFCGTVTEVAFEAAPGERNEVTVSGPVNGPWRFEERGAALTVGPGCQPDGERAAICAAGDVHAQLGDGDDVLVLDSPVTAYLGEGDDRATARHGEVIGGPGRDVLTATGGTGAQLNGGPGDDQLAGGPGRDGLTGGGGHDAMVGGAGDDRLTDGDGQGQPVDADLLDGGDGRDEVLLYPEPQAYRVDLRQTQQYTGLDRLRGFEDVGGGYATAVIGTDGPNRLTSGGRVVGLGGDDVLAGHGAVLGGEGDDQLQGLGSGVTDGGPGDDVIGDLDHHRDNVRCGPGRDRARADTGDRLVGCEKAERIRLEGVIWGGDALELTETAVKPNVECDLLISCRGWIRMWVKLDGRYRALGRRRLICDDYVYEPCEAAARIGSFRLPLAARRLMRARRPVLFRAVTQLDSPGILPMLDFMCATPSGRGYLATGWRPVAKPCREAASRGS